MSRYHLVTLGCPKNEVDSEKLVGQLGADGFTATDDPDQAELLVVNTCAFIGEARQESIDTILALAEHKGDGARLVVTGCMAERYGDELSEAMPEIDLVAGFGHAVHDDGHGHDHDHDHGSSAPVGATATSVEIGRKPSLPTFDLLNLPRPRSTRPWAYVKVAEGCDRACGFCAIPSFRGPQRSRPIDVILDEVDALEAKEIVLVAQDLAAYGRDQGVGDRAIVPLVQAVSERVARTRLLYLYPSDLTDGLIDAICATGVPYFDLSLQHVSPPLVRRMRRWGNGDKFLRRIDDIRAREPEAAFRSNFIVGYPGETEDDHDQLLALRRGGRGRLVRLLRLLARGRAPTPPTSTARSTRNSWPSASPSSGSSRTRSPRQNVTNSSVRGSKSSWTPQERRARTAKPPRSTASSPFPSTSRQVRLPSLTVTGALGPDLEAE